MEQQYVLGCFIAFILSFLLLQRFIRSGDKNIKKQTPKVAGVEPSSGKDVARATDAPLDVVIVGAGVAGSALAYTLAKVCVLVDCILL